MLVEKFMSKKKNLVWCEDTVTIREAAKAMVEKKVSCVIVCKLDMDALDADGLPAIYPHGIITKSDLVSKVLVGGMDQKEPVTKVMSPQVVTVAANKNTSDCAELISKHRVHHLVVLGKKGDVVGIVSSWDVARETALDTKAWPYVRH